MSQPPRNGRLRRRFRPAVQRLEVRELLAVVSWNSDLNTPSNNSNEIIQSGACVGTINGESPLSPLLKANASSGSFGSQASDQFATTPGVSEDATVPNAARGNHPIEYSLPMYEKYVHSDGYGGTYTFYVGAIGDNQHFFSYISAGDLIQGKHGSTAIQSFTVDNSNEKTGYIDIQTNWHCVYTPDLNYEGQDRFGFTLIANGQSYVTTLPVVIYSNTPPSLNNPGTQNNTEGEAPDLTFNAVDPNNNLLTYTASGLPPGLSLDPTYGNITGTINYGDALARPYTVTVTATNDDLSASQTFTWNVATASPTIANAEDAMWDSLNNVEGQTVSIPVIGSDPNNLPLTYSATGLPPGLMIDSSTGIISGTVAAGADTGANYDVTVSVTNGRSDPATFEFPWTITQLALAPPTDRFSVTGDTVNFPVQVGNPRGGTLAYSANGLPDGLSIDPATGLISGVVASSAASGTPWVVTIDVTDGTETAEHSFS